MEPAGFGTRLRKMRNKRYEEYGHIVFGGPVGTLLSAIVAEVRWITPNGLTGVGLLARLAAAALLVLREPVYDQLAAALVLASIPIDIMDGSIARYRSLSSRFGSFFDKVSDSIAIVVFTAALAYRAWLDTGELALVFASYFIGVSLLFRRYIYWLRNYMVLSANGPSAAGANPGLSDLGLGQRLAYYVRESWRLSLASESDIYIALSVALIAGAHLMTVVWVAAAALAPWLVITVVARFVQVWRLDRS